MHKRQAYTYDTKEDVVSTTVPIKKMNEKMERFTINFEDITDEKLNLVFEWDKTRADVPIEILNVEETLQIIDNLKTIKKIESDIKKKNEYNRQNKTSKILKQNIQKNLFKYTKSHLTVALFIFNHE